MVRVTIIETGNAYVVVQRDNTRYRVPLESLVFGEYPVPGGYAYVNMRELTRGRIIQKGEEDE